MFVIHGRVVNRELHPCRRINYFRYQSQRQCSTRYKYGAVIKYPTLATYPRTS